MLVSASSISGGLWDEISLTKDPFHTGTVSNVSLNRRLAWSLHAVDADLRRRLVPSAIHAPEALRAGLVAALVAHRKPGARDRVVMVAVTLLAGVNDHPEDARAVADFVAPLRDASPRVVVDLIPYNPIPGDDAFVRPTFEAVANFQRALKDRAPGLFVGVRNARGDDEMAACGQLATDAAARVTGPSRLKI